jgi:hypothetical protein
MIFLALSRHSFGCCPIQGAITVDPAQMLRTNLDLILRGLEVREPPLLARSSTRARQRSAL